MARSIRGVAGDGGTRSGATVTRHESARDATATHRARTRPLARRALIAFLFTFVTARVIVFLIMDGTLPDLFVHVGGTHVHHLNFGIFLLAGCGAWLLFRPPGPDRMGAAAALYGVGLALTFDEFGMWVHLGGGYWQRASLDAVGVIAALLGLAAVAPPRHGWRTRHLVVGALAAVVTLAFFVMLLRSLKHHDVGDRLRRLEQQAPR